MTTRADELAEQGVALALAGRFAEAADAFRSALAIQPGHPRASVLLGSALNSASRHQEAIAHADRMDAAAASPEAWIIRGDALRGLSDHAGALACYETAARWVSRRAEALAKSAGQHFLLRHYEAASAAYDAALALRPEAVDTRMDRSLLRLTLGDFAGGWSDYEVRWRRPAFLADSGGVAKLLQPYMARGLRKEDLEGRRVLLPMEQGVGDMIMFASLLPDLAERAAQVVCVCEPRLLRLFSASFPQVRFLDQQNSTLRRDEVDLVVDVGELARLFRSRREDFPGRAYLAAPLEVPARWSERLGPRPPGLRIGLSWRGGVHGAAQRSMPLERLVSYLDLPGCELVSLQYGEVEEEIAAANAKLKRPIRLFPRAEIDDFAELAGLLSTLDVVVSVQTAIVHLCGATGMSCLAMLPSHPEWRYGATAASMPWYRSVELHRQAEAGDWSPVLQSVQRALEERLK